LQAAALVIGPDNIFNSRAAELAALAAQQRVPAIYHNMLNSPQQAVS
jgi:hypothetical protein